MTLGSGPDPAKLLVEAPALMVSSENLQPHVLALPETFIGEADPFKPLLQGDDGVLETELGQMVWGEFVLAVEIDLI